MDRFDNLIENDRSEEFLEHSANLEEENSQNLGEKRSDLSDQVASSAQVLTNNVSSWHYNKLDQVISSNAYVISSQDVLHSLDHVAKQDNTNNSNVV